MKKEAHLVVYLVFKGLPARVQSLPQMSQCMSIHEKLRQDQEFGSPLFSEIKVELNALRLVFHDRIQDFPLAMFVKLKLERFVLRKTSEAAVFLNHA